jgi:hypothetical protein
MDVLERETTPQPVAAAHRLSQTGPMNAAVDVGMLALFLGSYQYLRIRAGRRQGQVPPVQWGWLAVIVLVAVGAVVAGAVTR